MKKDERLRGHHNEQLETLPWKEKKRVMEDQLQQAVLFAFEEAPAMREKFKAAGMGPDDIRSLEDLQSLGITPKAQMR